MSRTYSIAAGMVSVLLALAGGPAAAADAPAPGAAPIATIPLQPYRKGVAARVTINGHTGLFSLDTAGGITLVSPDFAKRIGCEPWGQIVGYQMTGNRLAMPRCERLSLDIAGHRAAVPVAGVFDVAPLTAPDAAPIEGLLSLDAFAGQAISIDFAGGTLVVESPQSLKTRITPAREIPIRFLREANGLALAVAVELQTRNGTVAFELDSGNGGTLLVSKPYAALFGLDPAAAGPQPADLEIAPGIRARGTAFTPDLTIDGNLGMPFLKDWILTLDLGQRRAWLQPTKATPPPGMGAPPPSKPR